MNPIDGWCYPVSALFDDDGQAPGIGEVADVINMLAAEHMLYDAQLGVVAGAFFDAIDDSFLPNQGAGETYLWRIPVGGSPDFARCAVCGRWLWTPMEGTVFVCVGHDDAECAARGLDP